MFSKADFDSIDGQSKYSQTVLRRRLDKEMSCYNEPLRDPKVQNTNDRVVFTSLLLKQSGESMEPGAKQGRWSDEEPNGEQETWGLYYMQVQHVFLIWLN